MQLTWRDWAVLVAAVAAASLVPAFAFFFVPDYREMFAEFQERWPMSSSMLYRYYWLTPLFPVSVIGVWAAFSSRLRRNIYTFAFSLIGTVALLAWMWNSLAPSDLVLELIRRGSILH